MSLGFVRSKLIIGFWYLDFWASTLTRVCLCSCIQSKSHCSAWHLEDITFPFDIHCWNSFLASWECHTNNIFLGFDTCVPVTQMPVQNTAARNISTALPSIFSSSVCILLLICFSYHFKHSIFAFRVLNTSPSDLSFVIHWLYSFSPVQSVTAASWCFSIEASTTFPPLSLRLT